MKTHLDGMFWTPKNIILEVPAAENRKTSVFLFRKYLPYITWSHMTTLENNPTTLPQTETILKGQSVGGISIDQLYQVKNYGDGAKRLLKFVESGKFRLNEATVCAIHKFVGKEEALTWGRFRSSEVSIRGINYDPPHHLKLQKNAKVGFTFLEENFDPVTRAVAAFLFMAREQFFFDGNKRVASLVMNGVLIDNSFYPVAILNQDSEEFHTKLSVFYKTGDATDMMGFFQENFRRLFPDN